MIDIGRVLALPRGIWDAEKEYEIMDMVYDENGAYMCIQDSQGDPVTDEDHWAKIIDLTLRD